MKRGRLGPDDLINDCRGNWLINNEGWNVGLDAGVTHEAAEVRVQGKIVSLGKDPPPSETVSISMGRSSTTTWTPASGKVSGIVLKTDNLFDIGDMVSYDLTNKSRKSA